MDWRATIQDPDELRTAFAGWPDARYRPLTAWWWSGEPVTQDRIDWQLDRIIELGCGGFDVTGLALHGPAGGSVADDPPAFSPEWVGLLRHVAARARQADLGIALWSPFQTGKSIDVPALLRDHPEYRGEMLRDGEPAPYGFDYGNPEAVEALAGEGTVTRGYLEAVGDLYGDIVCGMFEDEFPGFPRWSPAFAKEFREAKGYDVPPDVFDRDHGPRTPAMRWDVFDVATTRVERGYTRWQADFVEEHALLAGYDQNSRRGTPLMSSFYYLDPFRTMTWANAPGTDHMGDARFHLSIADLQGGARVWLEGFHSFGWGMSLSDQMRLLFEWGREGASLYLPHGMYYSGRALWWEWAPPEVGWKQPGARHYPAFAAACGRLMSVLSAGAHVPEVAVLYPISTMWAGTSGHLEWEETALGADQVYAEVFGVHGMPSCWDPERFQQPSVLAEAGYDRIAVDEPNLATFDIPIVIPACRVLRTETLRRLVEDAERGRVVVVVEPAPAWSAERGRDDPEFLALADRLRASATIVGSAAEVADALPPPRVEGLRSQWRRIGDLDVVLITGAGSARLRGMAGRAPQRWDVRTGVVTPHPATVDGKDLVVSSEGPDLLLSLPSGTPVPPREPAYDEVMLPEVWACAYLPWGENRWGDYRLPASEGTPPVERRTFAFREGDEHAWAAAPVTPEDVQQPLFELGFEDRMAGHTGRVPPEERTLPDGWREVVATYGPKGRLADGTELEYSERLGVEDIKLTTPLGLKGWVEPWKADLGEEGSGVITSWALADAGTDTHLVVEATGIVTVTLDGEHVVGPVDAGLVTLPVHLTPGWHRLDLVVEPRRLSRAFPAGYRGAPRTRITWSLRTPYERRGTGIWGGPVVHPDYKGSPGPRRFRRTVSVPERARVTWTAWAQGEISGGAPDILEAGDHVIEVTVGSSPEPHNFTAELELIIGDVRVFIGTDELWESAPVGADEWTQVFVVGAAGAIGFSIDRDEPARRSPLLDVGWLEGPDTVAGHAVRLWADSPEPPPPAWFTFTAPPGARSLTLPIDGAVEAWLDGEPVPVVDGRLGLREHARVAVRVQAPAGRRGASCFTEHPLLELGDGTIKVGVSWHRQGLDVFSGVILHRTTIEAPRAGSAVLDLGEVAGSVAVRVNGADAGVLFVAPWRIDIELEEGANTIELEVANTLGPLASRGIPTPFGPEDQRFSGILDQPRLLLERT